jgi:hypothetical protein
MSRDLKNIRQPLNTFFQQNVEPFQKSSIILSGGYDRPYYYSLGNQSTVPFVRLQGSGGTQKEFTWGESVEVLPGQNVQVESASYMPGDIQIQSGLDIANKPARTTIPIKVLPDQDSFFGEGPLPANSIITPIFPCDCRNARRAYLGCLIEVADDSTFRISGINKQHSWPGRVEGEVSAIEPTGKKYSFLYEMQALTLYSMIPLGFGADYADPSLPMTLADYVTWELNIGSGFNGQNNFFYTLEYL